MGVPGTKCAFRVSTLPRGGAICRGLLPVGSRGGVFRVGTPPPTAGTHITHPLNVRLVCEMPQFRRVRRWGALKWP